MRYSFAACDTREAGKETGGRSNAVNLVFKLAESWAVTKQKKQFYEYIKGRFKKWELSVTTSEVTSLQYETKHS